jgi:ABC-type transporter Mla MlaB component
MLRITCVPSARFRTLFRLEGNLSGPYVEFFAQVCSAPEVCRPVGIDLASVHYVDSAGRRLLQELLQRGAHVVAASGFVKELLHLENR